jgi:coproporphyrinogen III oxidase-like Fe-S oxidoreductase
MNPARFDDYFEQLHRSVNVEAIRHQWLALGSPYHVDDWLLPLPVWAQRPYDYSGPEAWEILRHDLATADSAKPLCIYLHSPFCSTKCGYCDCYSFKLGGHQAAHIQGYVSTLCDEMRLWSQVGNLRQRPVTTMHMGGGTPTFLGEAGLSQLVECCRACFATSAETEWALESTIESLTPGMIETMHHLGYRRLHIGVESLEEQVRVLIGRRRPVPEVLDRIQSALELGWIVSVDLVCGLPGQTMAGFVAGIQTLVDLGVNGFSLYQLLIYPQNRKWAEKHGLSGRSQVPNYFMYQAGATVLLEHGYSLNLFNHWADERDANIYFTFPTRYEDCLAIGTIADGVFGDFHYRHPRYAPYLQNVHSQFPGLEGGLRRNTYENVVRPLVVAVQSGYLPPRSLPAYERPLPGGGSLLVQWQEMALVEPDPRGGLRLTTSGSWFTGNMIKALSGCYPR